MLLKKNSQLYGKNVKLNVKRLEKAIELSRFELLKQLERTGYNFSAVHVVLGSRKLDRLLNLYHRSKPGTDRSGR